MLKKTEQRPSFKSDAIQEYFERIIYQNKLTILHLHGSAYDPDVVNLNKRVIIINCNYETHFSYDFRVAHEIAHLLHQLSSSNYHRNYIAKVTIEKRAHIDAIQLLLDFYFADLTSLKWRWDNRFNFINAFGLGPLTHLVERLLTPIKKVCE